MPERDLDQELPAIAGGDAEAFARWMAGPMPTVIVGLSTETDLFIKR